MLHNRGRWSERLGARGLNSHTAHVEKLMLWCSFWHLVDTQSTLKSKYSTLKCRWMGCWCTCRLCCSSRNRFERWTCTSSAETHGGAVVYEAGQLQLFTFLSEVKCTSEDHCEKKWEKQIVSEIEHVFKTVKKWGYFKHILNLILLCCIKIAFGSRL